MKLSTSAAAMDALGPDYRFTTDLLAEAPVRGGKVRSDLFPAWWRRPTMLAEDYRDLAQQLRAAGVTQVQGDLVADDSFFDGVPLGTAWSWDDEPYYYSAVTSGLTVAPDTDYDSGTTIVKTSPTAVGSAPAVELQPRTDAVQIVNRATTGAAGSGNRLSVAREHASDRVVVSGTIGADAAPDTEWVTVPDPTTYAADVLARALAAGDQPRRWRARGRDTRRRDRAGDARLDDPAGAADAVPLSNNMHGEALVKTMGQEATGTGSWPPDWPWCVPTPRARAWTSRRCGSPTAPLSASTC